MCFNNSIIKVILSISILISGCSSFQKVIDHPNIYQGNCLVTENVSKIHIGMNKNQILYILGTPVMRTPFSSNVWYYIFRQQINYKGLKQQKIILTFNKNDILININNKLRFYKDE